MSFFYVQGVSTIQKSGVHQEVKKESVQAAMAPRWPPWLQDGHHGSKMATTTSNDPVTHLASPRRVLTYGKVASGPRAWCRSSMYTRYLQFKSRAFIKRLKKSLSSGGFCFKFFFGVHPVFFSAQPWPFPSLDRRV